MLENIVAEYDNNLTVLLPLDSAVSEFVNSPAYQSMTSQEIAQLVRYHTIRGNYKVKDLIPAGPFLRTLLQQPGLSGGQRLEVSGPSTGNGGEDDVYFYSGLGQNSSIWSGALVSDLHYTFQYITNSLLICCQNLETTKKLTIHVIDSVLTMPMSVTETALAVGLTSFLGAVTTANMDLNTNDDVTYFLPTDTAFQTVGSALNDASDDELQNILNYHYLNDTGVPLYTSNIDKARWNTAEGENVQLSYENDNSLFVNSAAVTRANMLVANGVAHVIDQYVLYDARR